MTSREVAEAVGLEGETIAQKRDRLRAVVQTPTAREIAARELLEVESQIAERDRAALRIEGLDRVKQIRRAYGGERDGLEQDIRKIQEAADEYARVWRMMVERYVKLGRWRGEYDALDAGFALGGAPLPALPNLGASKDLGRAQETVARVGVPDTVRVFDVNELIDTDGYALLVRAGQITSGR
jgi:ElaB/YqjD/DUF883 family membrane-anchored ribosome-binding protein